GISTVGIRPIESRAARGCRYAAAVDPEPGEAVFFHGHPSWRSMIAFYLRGLLVAVLAGVIAGVITAIVAGHVQVSWVIAAVLACFVVVIVAGLVRRLRTTYTDRKSTRLNSSHRTISYAVFCLKKK